jgi:hypothetical protein
MARIASSMGLAWQHRFHAKFLKVYGGYYLLFTNYQASQVAVRPSFLDTTRTNQVLYVFKVLPAVGKTSGPMPRHSNRKDNSLLSL